ncbi:hypothetical protein G6F51_014461 [Rhizopus arrhizus]|uniref:Uncharacterized protein n=1 Tax=Rhizopus oryzae TaxID=64495 RepID=A0A9P6XM88_RHIOR|nr:hypothetical protein G6F51_014461 [Rhizopus arrhizus]
MASHSWKASVPMAAVETWPLTHSTGIESHMASSKPEVVLAIPGPEVTNTTPVRPVLRAYPSAACTAACSWRTSTWRRRGSAYSASYSGRTAPPG